MRQARSTAFKEIGCGLQFLAARVQNKHNIGMALSYIPDKGLAILKLLIETEPFCQSVL
jgi:hypothetical protein